MDLLILILVILLGIFFGILTGLTPGIHINLIASFILINFSYLNNILSLKMLIIFIIVMGVIHSFIDFIPSILFGVPTSDTNLSILPAHRMVLDGNAYEAIFLSSIGSLFGMFFSYIIAPLFYFGLDLLYNSIHKYVIYFLIIIAFGLIFTEDSLNKKFWAFIILIFSASLGFLILNSNNISSPLLILFSGIFGLSTLINSLFENKSKFPNQKLEFKFKFDYLFFKSIVLGGFSASICSITPGIGNSQAAIISSLFFKNINSKLFIVTISAINTINFILSFLTFYLISKSRNGAVFVISQISSKIEYNDLLFYFLIIFFISIIGFFLTLFLGKKIILIISKLNIYFLNLIIIFLLISLIFYLTNFIGLIALIVSTSLGLFTILIGVKRIHLMNILLIPIIFNLYHF